MLWDASSFKRLGQVNLEYLGRVVFNTDGVLYPDSLVGTDSHTPMINGLGVYVAEQFTACFVSVGFDCFLACSVGWGVGGIEAEAVMLGQAVRYISDED